MLVLAVGHLPAILRPLVDLVPDLRPPEEEPLRRERPVIDQGGVARFHVLQLGQQAVLERRLRRRRRPDDELDFVFRLGVCRRSTEDQSDEQASDGSFHKRSPVAFVSLESKNRGRSMGSEGARASAAGSGGRASTPQRRTSFRRRR